MNFISCLIAVLVALWLTGNVQAGSVLGSIFVFLGWGIAVIAAIIVILFIVHELPTPMKLWEDFKSGRFRMR